MFRRFMLFLALWALAGTHTADEAFGATSGVDFQLKGVLISPTSRSALINGKIAREGERVAGVEIVAIEEGEVRVLTGSQEYTVLVGSSAWLQPTSVAKRDPSVRHVKSGDTLSGIAEEYAGNGVSLNQVMVALYEANPQAFDGNINRLRAGAVLQVPGANEIRRHLPDMAMAEVIRQTETWKSGRLQPVRAAQAPARIEVAPLSVAATPEPDEYGPVRFGETLSEIAVEISGAGISMNEMMIALYEANPQAFGDSIDLLHEGAVLRIPDTAEMRRYETLTAHTF